MRNSKKRSLAAVVGIPLVAALCGCATPNSIQTRRDFYSQAGPNASPSPIEAQASSDGGYAVRVPLVQGSFGSAKDIPKEMAGVLKAYGYGVSALLDGATWTRPFHRENWIPGQRPESTGEITRYLLFLGGALYSICGGHGGEAQSPKAVVPYTPRDEPRDNPEDDPDPEPEPGPTIDPGIGGPVGHRQR